MTTFNSGKDKRGKQIREQLAAEAARIMATEGVDSFLVAKQKAAARMGIVEAGHLPRNTEIEQALMSYLRLFSGENHISNLLLLRETALKAMRNLKQFDPRLVGPVLSGSAGQYTEVDLHLFSDSPKDVAAFLFDQGIPFTEESKRFPNSAGTVIEHPVFRITVNDIDHDLTVFPVNGIRQAPPSPVDGKPMARASIANVEALIEQNKLEIQMKRIF